MTDESKRITIVGAGLAGSEAAWQLAERGFPVRLYEMRPTVQTGAHESDKFAELVCSNSLGSNLFNRASGLLKTELRTLGSLLISLADETALPAGGALAVDRASFSEKVTKIISNHPKIEVIRQEVLEIPEGPTIISSGPLTSAKLSQQLSKFFGHKNLFFFDAIAPIIYSDSIDLNIAFRASRYDHENNENGDYINCPFSRSEYDVFVNSLRNAERIQLKSFEEEINRGVSAGSATFFEGCLPIEVLASRGQEALAFGPLRPVGSRDPRSSKRPHAVLQLRQDNLAGDLYNMVGFQTNLTFSEQKRIFRQIPGLANAEFARFGQMHRNTFIASPLVLKPSLNTIKRNDLFFAGQITGVEGYAGNIATGLIAARNMARILTSKEPLVFPVFTMIGSLLNYITQASMKDFQPMKANFGLFPKLEDKIKNKNERYQKFSERALSNLINYCQMMGEPFL